MKVRQFLAGKNYTKCKNLKGDESIIDPAEYATQHVAIAIPVAMYFFSLQCIVNLSTPPNYPLSVLWAVQ